MYIDVVHRTQIYLDDEEAGLLGREAARTGASRSELIRRAIRTQYGAQTAETRLAGLRASAGAWRSRSETGAEYVENIRGDLDDRFEQLGLR
ncbi:MAG: ribbon-helix-helix protein, CopG family [Pseudonocardiaceae bacterium]|nr:ribbon-helix-helix protein, CopG family [Pseudonocardiaceae bacterium]